VKIESQPGEFIQNEGKTADFDKISHYFTRQKQNFTSFGSLKGDYMNLEWQFGEPITQDTLSQIESQLGVRFPLDFAEVILEHSGAYLLCPPLTIPATRERYSTTSSALIWSRITASWRP
jgi:hypothetical protein